jgi:sigma-E factor negative regulatory protein RseC
MLETRATVVQIHAKTALVLANQVSGCEQCNGQGCGSSKVAQLFCSQPRKFEVDNPISARVGDEVIVSVADGAVLRGIGLVYLLPLVLMGLIGGLASVFSPSGQTDAYVALGAVMGLFFGLVATRLLNARQARNLNNPYIARLYTEKSSFS